MRQDRAGRRQIASSSRLRRSRRDRLLLPHPRAAAARRPSGARFAILRRCLPRFAELFARHGVRATFFVVGARSRGGRRGARAAGRARARRPRARQPHPHAPLRLRAPAARAHRRRDRPRARRHRAPARARRRSASARPATTSPPRRSTLLRARGYRYDSSVFPSPPYYGAKAAVMGAMRVVGRTSGSSSATRACCWRRARRTARRRARPIAAGARRHRRAADRGHAAGAPARDRHQPDARARLAAPRAWSRRRCARRSSTSSCTASTSPTPTADGIPPALVARQPDLRRPLAHKLAALDETLSAARAAGARFATLAEAAATL